MDASILPLHELFQPDRQFRVPLYQRPYVWNKEKQWEPLWEDVNALAKTHLTDGEDPGEHFLGAIVVRQQHQPTGDIPIRDVIDGQQRLTTLQLLVDAVEEAIRESVGDTRESRFLRKLTLNDPGLYDDDDQFKVWPTQSDQPVFRTVMRDQIPVNANIEGEPIAQAHAYFKEAAHTWISHDEMSSSRESRIVALVSAIREGLRVVVIDLSRKDNAQAIFETLNARGTRLLASDLVKNYLLLEARNSNVDVDRLHADHWKSFESEYWREEVSQGRLYWPRIDAFIYYWLTLRKRKLVKTQRLYDEFRHYYTERRRDGDFGRDKSELSLGIASSLSHYARVYESLKESEHGASEIRRFFYRWEVSELQLVTPLLMWLFGDEADMDTESQIETLDLLESWFMRRMVCRWLSRGYQNFLPQLLGGVTRVRGSDVPKRLKSILSDARAEGVRCPTDEEIRNAICNGRSYGVIARGRLRMILEAVEDHLRAQSGKAEESCPRSLTIEHLMPVKWTEDKWPSKPEADRDERTLRIHTLGNLTLVNKKLNPHMSNSAWHIKREKLGNSTLYLNARLRTNETWNEESIRERSEWMSKVICAIWPVPV